MFIAFEEREQDLVQNVASLGFDLNELVRRELISIDHIHVERTEIEESGEYDLEGLFLRLDAAITQVGAKRVVIDTLEDPELNSHGNEPQQSRQRKAKRKARRQGPAGSEPPVEQGYERSSRRRRSGQQL